MDDSTKKGFEIFQKALRKVLRDNPKNASIISRKTADEISGEHPKVFPYLVTEMTLKFYHIIVLPNMEIKRLIEVALIQSNLNNLNTHLVLGEKIAVYFKNNQCNIINDVPSGGIIVTDKLLTCLGKIESVDFDPTFQARRDELRKYCETQTALRGNVCLCGDLTKGGRKATPEELESFGEANIFYKNIPKGLVKCMDCGMFKGVCLDPSEMFRDNIMTVSCKCENKNKCAYCQNVLYDYKLSSNYYNINDDQIWHVPGFICLSHICP